MLPGRISPDRFYLSFRLLRSTTTLSEFHSQFQFHMCHVHPAPAGLFYYTFFFFFRVFHTCVCIVTPPFVPTVWKAKRKVKVSFFFSRQSADGTSRPVIRSCFESFCFPRRGGSSCVNKSNTSSPSRTKDDILFPEISTCVGWLSPINFTFVHVCPRHRVNSFPQFAARRKVRSIHCPVISVRVTTGSNKYPSARPGPSSERKSSSPPPLSPLPPRPAPSKP